MRALGDLAITAGVLVLLFVVWQGWWSDREANETASRVLLSTQVELASGQPSAPHPPADADAAAVSLTEPPASSLAPHDTIGIIHLPAIQETRVVKEGTTAEVLNEGVLGHYPGTGAPGAVGNFAVAGHRTTYGRPLWDLGELERGDAIVVETKIGYHIYRLDRLDVVPPTRWQVLAPVPGHPDDPPTEASMVLTACHPKFSAEQRLIAYATLDRSVPRAEGPPPELDGAASEGGR